MISGPLGGLFSSIYRSPQTVTFTVPLSSCSSRASNGASNAASIGVSIGVSIGDPPQSRYPDTATSTSSRYFVNRKNFSRLVSGLEQPEKHDEQKGALLAKHIFLSKLATLPFSLLSTWPKCLMGWTLLQGEQDSSTCPIKSNELAAASLIALGALEMLVTLGDLGCAGYDWYLQSHQQEGLRGSEKVLVNLMLKLSNLTKPHVKIASKLITGPIPYFVSIGLMDTLKPKNSSSLMPLKVLNAFGKANCASLKATTKPEIMAHKTQVAILKQYAEKLRTYQQNNNELESIDVTEVYETLMNEIEKYAQKKNNLGTAMAQYEWWAQALNLTIQLIRCFGNYVFSTSPIHDLAVDFMFHFLIWSDCIAATMDYSSSRQGETRFPLGFGSDALAVFLLGILSNPDMAKTGSIFLRACIPFLHPFIKNSTDYDASWTQLDRWLQLGPKIASFISTGIIAEYQLKPAVQAKATYEALESIRKQLEEKKIS